MSEPFVSDFTKSIRRDTERSLRCSHCPAANRPGATYIELDQTGSRAYCSVCSFEGPVAQFQQKASA